MKTITKFLLISFSFMVMNVLGKLLFDIEPMSIEVLVTLSLAITYCSNEDDKKS